MTHTFIPCLPDHSTHCIFCSYNLVRTCFKPTAVKLYKKTNEEVKAVTKTFLAVSIVWVIQHKVHVHDILKQDFLNVSLVLFVIEILNMNQNCQLNSPNWYVLGTCYGLIIVTPRLPMQTLYCSHDNSKISVSKYILSALWWGFPDLNVWYSWIWCKDYQ